MMLLPWLPAGLQLVLPNSALSRQTSRWHCPGLPLAPCCPTVRALPDGTSSMSADVAPELPWFAFWALGMMLPEDASCINRYSMCITRCVALSLLQAL